MKNTLRRIEQALYENEKSREWMQIVDPVLQHAVYLVNNDRETLIAWHKCKGPDYIVAFMQHLENPEAELPLEIGGVSRESLLFQMSNVLQEKGTPKLKAFIDSYALMVMEYAKKYNSLYTLSEDLGINLTKNNG